MPVCVSTGASELFGRAAGRLAGADAAERELAGLSASNHVRGNEDPEERLV